MIDANLVVWSNGNGVTYLDTLDMVQFPPEMKLYNPKTRNVVRFHVDQETMINNEFFDGEAMAYISDTGIKLQVWN